MEVMNDLDLYPAWDIWHGGHFMEVTPGGDIVWEYEDHVSSS